MKLKPQHSIEVKMGDSYKLGMEEVVGLKDAIAEAMAPIQTFLKENIYWDALELESMEYKSRDGFIPYGHNCGGLAICVQIPSCEGFNFGFLDFGECDGCNEDCSRCVGAIEDTSDPEYNGGECHAQADGHLDAYLRIWFKFEGINEDGEMEFYLNACGGNGDAPYFRTEHLSDVFEASFTCKSVKGLKRAASKHIRALIKAMGGSK